MRALSSSITGPYKGLVPYSEEDAHLFFGRDADRKAITANLLGSRLTLLYGESGVGKSSVLRAGVAYHLRRLARENFEDIGAPELAIVVFDAWQEDPLSGLYEEVRRAVKESLGAEDLSRPDPSDLCSLLGEWAQQLDGDLLIVFDQFEEFLRLKTPASEQFATGLVKAVNSPNLRANFLFSIREDSLAQLDRFKGKIPALFENYLRLDHLDLRAAREAITKPVEEWSRNPDNTGPRVLEPSLVEEVLKQIPSNHTGQTDGTHPPLTALSEEKRIEAPVLQVVMTRLWEDEARAGSPLLRLETLQKLGNSDKIFDDYLKARLRGLSSQEERTAGSIFLHLVDREGIRSPAAAQDLADRTGLPLHRIEPVLNTLKERGVLVVRSGGASTARFEVPHDILGFSILRWRRQFEENRRAARSNWLRWGWTALGLTLLALVIGLPLWNHRVEERRRLANAERLAAKALYYSNRRLDLALLLAAQAARTADSGDIRNGLLSTLQEAPQLKAFLYGNHPSGVSTLAFDSVSGRLAAGTSDGHVQLWKLAEHAVEAPLLAHADRTRVAGLAFYQGDTGSSMLATAGEDGAIYLWDLLRRRSRALIEPKLELERRSTGFSALTVSADGRLLAAGMVNGTVLLWDLQDRSRRPLRLASGGGGWPVVAFTPESILVVGGADGVVRLYKPSGSLLATLNSGAGAIVSLAVDQRGRLLAAGTETGTVLLWRLSNRRLVSEPVSAHSGPALSLAFSPTSERLATGGADRRVRLWTWSKDLPNLKAEGDSLTGGHEAGVRGLVFSSDGQTLASGGDDGRVCLWSVEKHPPLGTRIGQWKSQIEAVSFSPNGQLLASGGTDGRVRLWDVIREEPSSEVLAGGAIWSLAFSSEGSMIAAGGESGIVRLWKFRQQQSLLLNAHGHGIGDLAFSPNGGILAWADLDWTIQRWDLHRKRPLPMLTGHTAGVWDIAFSPDGESLASGGEDQTVRIWDLNQGRQIGHSLTEHSKGVVTVAYAQDGKMLASGGLDGKILFWDLQQQKLIGPLFGNHPVGVSDIAFSPDGALLASCDQEGHIRLWSPLTRQPLGEPLEGHQGEVKSLAFRPDGSKLASGGGEGDLLLWDMDLNSWISRACAKANRNLSLDEWRQLVDPEALYKKTCPDLPAGEGVLAAGISPGKE